MSSFVCLPNATRIGLHLRPEAAEGFYVRQLNSKFGVEIRAKEGILPQAELLSGKDAGTLVAKLAPNQRAVLRMGWIQPYKYQAMLVPNPTLLPIATVQHALIVEPKEETELALFINSHKEVDLTALEWLVRIYLFE